MGAWRYCDNCNRELESPWSMEIRDIVEGAVTEDFHPSCPHCESPNDYSGDREFFIDTLSELLVELKGK